MMMFAVLFNTECSQCLMTIHNAVISDVIYLLFLLGLLQMLIIHVLINDSLMMLARPLDVIERPLLDTKLFCD